MTKKHVFVLNRAYSYEGERLEGVFTTARRAICHVRDTHKSGDVMLRDEWVLYRCALDGGDSEEIWSWDEKRPPDPKVDKARGSTS